MRPKYRLNIFHVSILAALFLTLDADGEDSDCEIDIKVRRGTVYESLPGEDLRLNCTVSFCNNSPPTVTWYKQQTIDVPVDFSRNTHLTTEWELLNHSEGIAFLSFHKTIKDDTSVYQCRGGGGVSHNIKVFVRDSKLTTVTWMTQDPGVELATGTWTTLEQESPAVQDTFWPYVYRVVGVMAFVITVLAIFVGPRCRCKGKSKDTPDLNHQPCHNGATTHI